jgi:surfeit locus 1 family protein
LRGLVAAGAFALIAIGVLVSLGNWQLDRLAWKQDLLAAVAAREDAAPVPAPGPTEWTDFDIDEWLFAPVEITGRFDGQEIHYWIALSEPKGPLGGQGYFVVQTFTATDGWTVIVNRGFVPVDRKQRASRPESLSARDTVTIVGRVREFDTPHLFTPEPDRQANIWFARDRLPLIQAFDLSEPRVAPYAIDLVAEMTPPGGLPQAGETRMSFRNPHLGYALTWYGLALALAGVFAVFAWKRLRPR